MMKRASGRGYALLFVLVLMIALGVVVGGLLAVLGQSVTSARASHEDLQQMYGCDGAVRLALKEAERHAGDIDNSRLDASLAVLTNALKSDVNPRTGTPYANVEEIRAETSDAAVLSAVTLPFLGMQYIEEGTRIEVAARSDGGRGRACQAQVPTRRRTMSYFQFALASTDVLSSPTTSQATAGTAGDVFLLTHSQPGVARRQATASGGFTIQHVNLSEGDVFRPTPPSGQPWRFVNKKKRLGGLLGKKRRNKARRPTLESFVKYPTDLGGVPDPTMSRFVKGADIRIINGDWFIPDGGGAFPGRRIWSDQPSVASSSTGMMFSSYERDPSGASRGGAAVVRYGLVSLHAANATDPLVARPLVRGFCPSDLDKLAEVSADGVVTCGGGEVAVPPTSGEADPFRAAASIGFLDPSDDTPILPIVVDVDALRRAFVTASPGAGDLGEARCLGDNPLTCPVDKRFDGSIWIGSLPGGTAPDGTASASCPLVNHPAPTTAILSGLGCVRPNAVVLFNLDDASAFNTGGELGLSIGSNLPMYVVGNVNARAPGSGDARVALYAPQITALSRGFDFKTVAWPPDDEAPGSAPAIPAAAASDLTWNASLFTSWSPGSTALRTPAVHVIRQLEGNIRVDLTGSIVAMFTREQFLQKTDFNKGKGSYSSSPDPAVTGLPVFSPDGDPGESGRMVAGSVRFPGNGTRDLRNTALEQQPPNAPRLSVDLQPLDKR